MQAWYEFYSVLGGAAAALLGLLFVAVSINASAILSEAHSHSRHLAEQAFQNYVSVLLVSVFALFPALSLSEFGFVTLGVTAVSGVWVIVRLYLVSAKPRAAGARVQSLRRQILSLLGFTMLIYAAVRMAFNMGDSRSTLAVATVLLLLAATRVSWDLLLTVAAAKPAGSID
jgi:hypothetical protein